MNFLKAGKTLFGGGDSDGLNPMTMFKQLDKNGDGKITEDDFVLVVEQIGLGSVGDSVARQAFRQMDKNKNGKLDLSEALAAFESIQHLLSMANQGK